MAFTLFAPVVTSTGSRGSKVVEDQKEGEVSPDDFL